MNELNLAIIGCGDYVQRWESAPISESKRFVVKSLFDTNSSQAEKLQKLVGGDVVDSAETIYSDPQIDIVCVFVPPWIRKDVMEKCVNAGKHIITTKPLAPSVQECESILNTVDSKVKCGVFYGRTGDAVAKTLKAIFISEQIGKLALYKQDWLHHYPTWNDWATDAEKNGGPFMDAMIHNMNLVKYLMGRPVKNAHFFSDNHAHPDMKCNDTEFMKLDFEKNGSAHLFITWAADLEVFDQTGNAREHIDICYMVTDDGWRITIEEQDGEPVIVASKESETKQWNVKPYDQTPYDAFAESISNNIALRSDIIQLADACDDIKLLKTQWREQNEKF